MPYAARILVPTDFGPLSAVALEHAIALALVCRASIHLMHVRVDHGHPSSVHDARLAELAARCQGEGLVATFEVFDGAPAPGIVQVAADRAVDLIVLGTHGRQGLSHMILGSVAEAVVRTAPCAVLSVRGLAPERAREPVGEALGLLPS